MGLVVVQTITHSRKYPSIHPSHLASARGGGRVTDSLALSRAMFHR